MGTSSENKQEVLASKRNDAGSKWILELGCGHTVQRRVNGIRTGKSFHNTKSPAPGWVFCEKCKDGIEVPTETNRAVAPERLNGARFEMFSSFKIGDRVGCVVHSRKEGVRKIWVLGYGTYKGETLPGKKVVGSLADALRCGGFRNPKIELDNGDVVWGCECWWGSEKRIKRYIGYLENRGWKVYGTTIGFERQKQKSQTSGVA